MLIFSSASFRGTSRFLPGKTKLGTSDSVHYYIILCTGPRLTSGAVDLGGVLGGGSWL